jgi:hypothetical protein
VIWALRHWGDTHAAGERVPTVWEHSCGAPFVPRTHCAECGEAVDSRALHRADA